MKRHESQPNLFFKNHGAVAGVFTVVGLVALALLIALLTNAIRRRRALKFDKDVAVAAREAAAAAHASPPDFHDFDDEEYSYGNANRSIYTDQTHGSYNQPPLKPTGYESFNLAELPAATMVGAGYGGEQRVGGGPWNSAGVGATGLNRARSTTTPYNAFAGPVGHGNTMPVADPFHDDQSVPIGGVYPAQPQPYHVPGDSREANLLAAAGIGGAVGAVTTAREHGSAHSRSRSGKLNASPPAMSEHEEGAYNPYEYSQYPPSVPVYQPPQQQQQQRPVSTATSAENPYSAYVSPTQDQYSGEDSDKHEEEEEEEDEDDDDDYRYGGGRRVLKVANE
ncbi:hypothetical protein BC835DRAFT_735086 [Cytidiella melzeri]|nr:hypothetical protein BC835DRAFT_735086 [Cytidiella melzeri]